MDLFYVRREFTFRQKIILGAIPFVVIILLYMLGAYIYQQNNPDGKYFPSVSKIITKTFHLIFSKDAITEEYLFFYDTFYSLTRLFVGIIFSLIITLLIAIPLGVIPFVSTLFYPVVIFVSIIPPLVVTPIFMIIFGLDEVVKIVIIVFGLSLPMIMDMYKTIKSLPEEQIIKSLTLGASTSSIMFRVVLPQMMPVLFNSLFQYLGMAFMFLIAAEFLSASEGLGYRIFIFRRNGQMDSIIPYAIWLTLLGYLIGFLIKKYIARKYPWYIHKERS